MKKEQLPINKVLNINKIKNIFWIALGIGCIVFFIYKVAKNNYTDYLLKNKAQFTKAVIIDERNYLGNHPVKAEFSYSYRFEINGERYTGNAHDKSLRIGDTIDVEYVKDNPNLNKPLHPKE